jgi:hypothetical protein
VSNRMMEAVKGGYPIILSLISTYMMSAYMFSLQVAWVTGQRVFRLSFNYSNQHKHQTTTNIAYRHSGIQLNAYGLVERIRRRMSAVLYRPEVLFDKFKRSF